MSTQELKPCPFCGGDALAPKNDHARMWVIRCRMCNAEVWEKNDGHHVSDFIPMVAFAWNRRAAIEAVPASAVRDAALEEAAMKLDAMARTMTYTDDFLGETTGRNLIDPRKAAAAIRALKGGAK